MKIPPSPRALSFDGKLAVQVLKALNPAPDSESSEDEDVAKKKVNRSRSKINRRDPYTKQAIDRRNLKI